jgi:hypothetical protein
VVVASVALWVWEDRRGQEFIGKLNEKSGIKQQLSTLDIELNDGTQLKLKDLRNK